MSASITLDRRPWEISISHFIVLLMRNAVGTFLQCSIMLYLRIIFFLMKLPLIMIERENWPKTRKYVRKQDINVEKCDNTYIRLWNFTTWKMMKNIVKEKTNDIINCFRIRYQCEDKQSKKRLIVALVT